MFDTDVQTKANFNSKTTLPTTDQTFFCTRTQSLDKMNKEVELGGGFPGDWRNWEQPGFSITV